MFPANTKFMQKHRFFTIFLAIFNNSTDLERAIIWCCCLELVGPNFICSHPSNWSQIFEAVLKLSSRKWKMAWSKFMNLWTHQVSQFTMYEEKKLWANWSDFVYKANMMSKNRKKLNSRFIFERVWGQIKKKLKILQLRMITKTENSMDVGVLAG